MLAVCRTGVFDVGLVNASLESGVQSFRAEVDILLGLPCHFLRLLYHLSKAGLCGSRKAAMKRPKRVEGSGYHARQL
jgi:hypothetical protein